MPPILHKDWYYRCRNKTCCMFWIGVYEPAGSLHFHREIRPFSTPRGTNILREGEDDVEPYASHIITEDTPYFTQLIWEYRAKRDKFCWTWFGKTYTDMNRIEYLMSKYSDVKGEVADTFKQYSINELDQTRWLEMWAKLDTDDNNMMDYQEFIDFLGVEDTLYLKRFFRYIDNTHIGFFSFSKFLTAMFTFCTYDTEKLYTTAFTLMSRRTDSVVIETTCLIEDDFRDWLRFRYEIFSDQVLNGHTSTVWYSIVPSHTSIGITYEEFKKLATTHVCMLAESFKLQTTARERLFGEEYWRDVTEHLNDQFNTLGETLEFTADEMEEMSFEEMEIRKQMHAEEREKKREKLLVYDEDLHKIIYKKFVKEKSSFPSFNKDWKQAIEDAKLRRREARRAAEGKEEDLWKEAKRKTQILTRLINDVEGGLKEKRLAFSIWKRNMNIISFNMVFNNAKTAFESGGADITFAIDRHKYNPTEIPVDMFNVAPNIDQKGFADVVEIFYPQLKQWLYARVYDIHQVGPGETPPQPKSWKDKDERYYPLHKDPIEKLYFRHTMDMIVKKDNDNLYSTERRFFFFMSDYGSYGICYECHLRSKMIWRFSKAKKWPPKEKAKMAKTVKDIKMLRKNHTGIYVDMKPDGSDDCPVPCDEDTRDPEENKILTTEEELALVGDDQRQALQGLMEMKDNDFKEGDTMEEVYKKIFAKEDKLRKKADDFVENYLWDFTDAKQKIDGRPSYPKNIDEIMHIQKSIRKKMTKVLAA